jgi:hypothetical protein
MKLESPTTIRLRTPLPQTMAEITRATEAQHPASRPMSWVVDLVLLLQAERRVLSPELQQLVPLAQVVIWAQQRRAMPTWEEICERWSCNRATAFRWLPDIERARKGVCKA